MKELFNYYGGTYADVMFTSSMAYAIDVDEWMRNTDRIVVFLSKYANLPPMWVEEQDIARLARLVHETCELIKIAAGKQDEEPNRLNDKNAEWL
jgi:hypothetical protein